MMFGAMMIGIFPFAFLVFVLLMATVCRGHACRTRTVPAALLGGSLLLLGIGGALLLLGSAFFMMKMPASMPHPFVEDFFRPPDPPPMMTEPRLVAEQLPAEAPDAESRDKSAASTASQTVQSPGPDRPAWMDAPMGRMNGGVYRTRVSSGTWHSRTECERELHGELRAAVRMYANRLLGDSKGQYVDLPMSYVHDHIVCGEWEERHQETFDTMIRLHELLEFDSAVNKQIEANYQQSVVQDRLGYTAAGGGVLLGLLTVVFGYLKLDTLTRGYYTGRLRLTAAAAILALAVIAAFVFVIP
jgi:hypothetical protein